MAFQRRQFLVVGVIGSLALAGAGPAQAKRMLGTKGPDKIVGTAKADVIKARGGDDRVKGRGGKDRLWGGPLLPRRGSLERRRRPARSSRQWRAWQGHLQGRRDRSGQRQGLRDREGA